MATNKIADGATITYTNAGSAIAAGSLVVVASGTTGCCGVAICDIEASTGVGTLAMKGVFECPAVAGTGITFTPGDVLYRDASTGKLTKTASGNTRVGRAWAAKAALSATALVKLNVP